MTDSSQVARAIRMYPRDSVAILIEDAKEGAAIVLQGGDDSEVADPIVQAAAPIPYGHKVALVDLDAGEPVIKYGERMGVAKKPIKAGEHVHVHNVRGLNTEERSVSVRG